ncbi:MAG: hypothetical protein ACK47B_09645 [Armatimonadota bacterium]
MHSWRRVIFVPVLLLGALLPAALESAEQPKAAGERARAIARALEARRLPEALAAAERAARELPDNPQIRLRCAQAQIARALTTNLRVQVALRDALLEKQLSVTVRWLATFTPDQFEQHRLDAVRLEELAAVARSPQVEAFRQAARRGAAECRPSLGETAAALKASQAALREARALGASGAELELTELWAWFLALLWRDDLSRLEQSVRLSEPESDLLPDLASLAKVFTTFGALTPDVVLDRCAEVIRRYPEDAGALAGAADLVGLVCVLAEKPDPLRKHLMGVLEPRYLPNGGRFSRERTPEARTAARELFTRTTTPREPNLNVAPAEAVWILYRRAHEIGARESSVLPYLPLRRYLLELAFNPESAEALLKEAARLDPRNAAVPLERARARMLVSDRASEALAELRAAGRLPRLSRSYLTAAPSTLRPFLNLDLRLRSLIKRAWPSYEGIFTTLLDSQLQAGDEKVRMEFRLLRLRLAELLCSAEDAADQAQGIDYRGSILRELIGLQEQLSPEQIARLREQLVHHERAASEFPTERTSVVLSSSGLGFSEYPRIASDRSGAEGMQLLVRENAYMIFPNVTYGRSPR